MSFKNVSINDQTNLSLINIKKDTINDIQKMSCREYGSSSYSEIDKMDTFYRWEEYNGTIINPSTHQYAYPAWVKFKVTKINYSVYNNQPKSIYEDTLFFTSGNVCGSVIQDTLKRRFLKKKYTEKKIIFSSFYNQEVAIDTSFTKPSNISFVNFDELELYPIPAREKLFFKFPEKIDFHVKFYNSISNQIDIPRVNSNTFDISFLQPGIYIAIIKCDQQEITKKFFIEDNY